MTDSERTEVLSPLSGRQRILKAAAALFAEKGYAAATTRELAGRLDIQPASLYHHFRTKEQLLAEVCLLAQLQGLEAIDEAVKIRSHESGLSQLKAIIKCHLEISLEQQEEHKVMLTETRSLEADSLDRLGELRDKYHQTLDTVIARAQQEGDLRSDIKPGHLRISLLNMLNWTVVWYSPDASLTPANLNDLFSSVFLKGALDESHK